MWAVKSDQIAFIIFKADAKWGPVHEFEFLLNLVSVRASKTFEYEGVVYKITGIISFYAFYYLSWAYKFADLTFGFLNHILWNFHIGTW